MQQPASAITATGGRKRGSAPSQALNGALPAQWSAPRSNPFPKTHSFTRKNPHFRNSQETSPTTHPQLPPTSMTSDALAV